MGEDLIPTGHLSGPSDLRRPEEDLLLSFQSACPPHLFLGTYTCVCQGVNAKDALAWPGGAGLYRSIPNVPALGTPGSASLTNLEPDLGRSAWQWRGKNHGAMSWPAQSAGGPGPGWKTGLPRAGRALGMGVLGWTSGPEKRLVRGVTKRVKVLTSTLMPARARVGRGVVLSLPEGGPCDGLRGLNALICRKSNFLRTT